VSKIKEESKNSNEQVAEELKEEEVEEKQQ
jgi:hypothetical protein